MSSTRWPAPRWARLVAWALELERADTGERITFEEAWTGELVVRPRRPRVAELVEERAEELEREAEAREAEERRLERLGRAP